MTSSYTVERIDTTGLDDIELAPRTTFTAVLLDRQPLWLDALAAVLVQHGIDTLASSTRTAVALRDVETLAPTALVLDPWIADEEMTGLELISALRERSPEIRIVGLGSVDGPTQIDAVFAAGADAYVLKVADPADVAQAIRHVCSDVIFFGASSARRAAGRGLRVVEDESDTVRLTKRELEILRIVAEGRANGEIAKLLWVTEQTVKFHLSNIYRKLGVSNRTEAGRWAHLHAIVPVGSESTEGTDDDLLGALRLRTAV